MARFTVFGAGGFIGSHLAHALHTRGYEVRKVERQFPIRGESLGHAIYCIGLTADFRQRPVDTVRAHVSVLMDVLMDYSFESFLYLSSTRVYAGAQTTAEDTALTVSPLASDQLYNISKLAGEAFCLLRPEPQVRVARLSNVIGSGDAPVNFIPSLLADCRKARRVELRRSPQSSKDYIGIEDVCRLLPQIASKGRHRIYNVASGANTTNEVVARHLAAATGATVTFSAAARTTTFPPIDISRIRNEFGFWPTPFESCFAAIAAGDLAQETHDHDHR